MFTVRLLHRKGSGKGLQGVPHHLMVEEIEGRHH